MIRNSVLLWICVAVLLAVPARGQIVLDVSPGGEGTPLMSYAMPAGSAWA